MESRIFKIFGIPLSLWACTWSPQAQAFTQCNVSLMNVYSGDGGYIWLYYTNGGSVELLPSNVDKTAVLSMAMTALVSGRTMAIRYSTDGVVCASVGRTDFSGAYLN